MYVMKMVIMFYKKLNIKEGVRVMRGGCSHLRLVIRERLSS